MSYRVRP